MTEYCKLTQLEQPKTLIFINYIYNLGKVTKTWQLPFTWQDNPPAEQKKIQKTQKHLTF